MASLTPTMRKMLLKCLRAATFGAERNVPDLGAIAIGSGEATACRALCRRNLVRRNDLQFILTPLGRQVAEQLKREEADNG